MDSILPMDPLALPSCTGGRTAAGEGAACPAAGNDFALVFGGTETRAVGPVPVAAEEAKPDVAMSSVGNFPEPDGEETALSAGSAAWLHRGRSDDSTELSRTRDDAPGDGDRGGIALPAVLVPAILDARNMVAAGPGTPAPFAPGPAADKDVPGSVTGLPFVRGGGRYPPPDGHVAELDLLTTAVSSQQAQSLPSWAAMDGFASPPAVERPTVDRNREGPVSSASSGDVSVPVGVGRPAVEIAQHYPLLADSTAFARPQDRNRMVPALDVSAPMDVQASSSGSETVRAGEARQALTDPQPPGTPRGVSPLSLSSASEAVSSPIIIPNAASGVAGQISGVAEVGGAFPESPVRMTVSDLVGDSGVGAVRRPSSASADGPEAVASPVSGSDSAVWRGRVVAVNDLPAALVDETPAPSFGSGAASVVASSKPDMPETKTARMPESRMEGRAPEGAAASPVPPASVAPAMRVQLHVTAALPRPMEVDGTPDDPVRTPSGVSAVTSPVPDALSRSVSAVRSEAGEMAVAGSLPQSGPPVQMSPDAVFTPPTSGERPVSGPGIATASGHVLGEKAGPDVQAVASSEAFSERAVDVSADDSVETPSDRVAGSVPLPGTIDPSTSKAAAVYGREAAAAPPAVSHQILEKIRHAASNDRIEITLAPADLGKLRLSLHATDGGVSVVVEAERPETLDLVRRNADSLARDLRDIGYGQVTFSFGGQDSPGDQRRTTLASADFAVPGETDAMPEVPPPVSHPSAASGSLDLRI
uniref:flagellar hook-length control protein FliK n=1 Tax=Paenirhodobacter enshiensis TaxID=1105367 RepID=UPI0035B0334E